MIGRLFVCLLINTIYALPNITFYVVDLLMLRIIAKYKFGYCLFPWC